MIEKLYSVSQAAEKLGGISTWTLHSWLSKGRLKRTKIGGRTMVSEDAIREFIASCNRETPKEQCQ
jgi:excisionase family DNA binding protein